MITAAVILVFIFLLYRQREELPRERKHILSYLMAFCAIFITVSMVRFPKEAFEAAVEGLHVWWDIVFPALLPFFVISQILIGLGVVHMMGVFLEPVMRPLFNVPGAGSFVMAMGLASGFPIGAVLTAELRARNLCNRVEAERLMSFCNTADPLFMVGAVAVGMLGYPQGGLIIVIAHYLSSLTLGLIMRFYRRREPASAELLPRRGSLMARALRALVEAREKDGRPLGRLMGDAIHRSIETLLLVGGFIILLSVVIRILDLMGVVPVLARGIAALLKPAGLSPALAAPLVSGLFEIDLGCQAAASAAGVAMGEKLIALGMIIAWSGLSVHCQVASIISKTDLRIAPYIAARLIHTLLAGGCTALLLGPAGGLLGRLALPVFLETVPTGGLSFWWSRTMFMLNQALIFLGILTVLGAGLYMFRRLRAVFFHARKI
ncbi:MAG TPA: sporulation integral membrane protein YlbJ [Bacillota bacterium]|nr:sporulation integral membrane protein YlbJ [Bacillota bacterium]